MKKKSPLRNGNPKKTKNNRLATRVVNLFTTAPINRLTRSYTHFGAQPNLPNAFAKTSAWAQPDARL